MEHSFLKPTSEADKYKDNGEWFKKRGQHVAAQYDKQYYRSYGYMNGGILGLGATGADNATGSWNYLGGSPVAAMWEYYKYYNVIQDNKQFGFAAKDYDNNPLPMGTTWQRGQKVRQLIKDLCGNLMSALQFASIDTRSITPAAANRKTKLLELTTIYKDLEPYFKKLEEMGAGFSPMGGMENEFESLEEAQQYIKYNYKEKMEIEAAYIVEDIRSRNDYTNFFYQVLLNALIAGVVAIKPFVKNGKVWWRLYNGTQVIWDNTVDSQHHRKDQQYMGVVRYMTVSEILTEYGDEMLASKEGKEMYKKLEDLNVDNYTSLGTFVNSSMPIAQRDGANITITVIDTWWTSAKDTRYVERTNEEYGSQYVAKLKKDAKDTDNFWWDTWYSTTLIGNLGQVQYGEATNLVENFEDKKIVEPPLVIWTPDMIMGYAQSLVGQMTQNQDVIDYYKNTIIGLAQRSLGKVFLFNADKLGKKTVADLVNDFKRYGASALTYQQGDDYEMDARSRLGEVVDLTIDPNVVMYDNLIKREEELMEKASSTSDIGLGQQSGYISLNSQMATIAQNQKGIFGLTVGFMQCIIQTLQLSTNMQKNIIAEHNDDYGIPLVTEQGQIYLKATKELSLEDMQIYMKFEDNITGKLREQLIAQAERYASLPDPPISMYDVSKIYTFKTMTELTHYFKDVAKKNEAKKAQTEEMMAAMQQEMQAMKDEAAMQQTALREQSANERNDANNETKLMDTMLKEGNNMPAA